MKIGYQVVCVVMYCKQLNYQIKNQSDSISLNGLGDYVFNALLFIFHLHQTHILDPVNLFIKNKFGLKIEYEQYEHSYYFIERLDILLAIQFTLSASCQLITARGLVRPLADARNYYSYLCKSHSKGIAGYPFKTGSSFF